MAGIAERGLRIGHEEVNAIIVPNFELLKQENITEKKSITDKIHFEIARLSKDLAPYKKIMSFKISYEGLPKTVTAKIKRDAVSKMTVS